MNWVSENGPLVDLKFGFETDSRVTSANQSFKVSVPPASMIALVVSQSIALKLCKQDKRLILSFVTNQRSAEFNQNFE